MYVLNKHLYMSSGTIHIMDVSGILKIDVTSKIARAEWLIQNKLQTGAYARKKTDTILNAYTPMPVENRSNALECSRILITEGSDNCGLTHSCHLDNRTVLKQQLVEVGLVSSLGQITHNIKQRPNKW